ncbi:MAG TPA: acyltransferase [Thermoanaerobaculia bacterium]|nr:acyltransferase [Thermoanaerobaculia bacterium]
MTSAATTTPESPVAAPRPGSQIPALTGVRALAAYLVFFHHAPTPWLEPGPLQLWRELHIGVTLFFVLSGFVITWRYDRQERRRESFLRGYFVNRFARIYPLYFFLVVPTMLLWGERSPRVWFFNLTIFSCFDSGIPQAWSLRVEECFYLAAPLLFLLWRRNALLPLAAGAAALAALVPVSLLPSMDGILGPPRYLMLYTFFGRFFEFYVGIWLAERVAAGTAAASRARRVPVLTLVGGAGIFGVVAALAAIFAATKPRYMYGLYHPAGIALNNFVLPVFVAVFYLGLIRERSPAQRLFATKAANLLGRSSYAFYLIHMGILREYLARAVVVGGALVSARAEAAATGFVTSTAGLFVLVNVAAIGLYKGVEAPANRYLRRRFASPASAPQPALS